MKKNQNQNFAVKLQNNQLKNQNFLIKSENFQNQNFLVKLEINQLKNQNFLVKSDVYFPSQKIIVVTKKLWFMDRLLYHESIMLKPRNVFNSPDVVSVILSTKSYRQHDKRLVICCIIIECQAVS